MILTVITPGPTLSIYKNGKIVIAVILSAQEAINMIRDLANEVKL